MTKPHLLAAGVLQLGTREVPCAVLSDRRRVLFDVPVEGMLDGLSETEREALTVHYEGHDGAPLEALDSVALVDVAFSCIKRSIKSRDANVVRIGKECSKLLQGLAMQGMRALAAERAGGAR